MAVKNQKVKVIYYGLIQSVVKKREEEIELPFDVTVAQLIAFLVERYGEEFQSSIYSPEGEVRYTARILLDGQDVRETQGLDTKIKGKKEASILVMVPPMAGG